MSNVKPGDLAIVVGCKSNPEINGRIVEVLSRRPPSAFQAPNGMLFAAFMNDQVAWLVKYIGGPGPVYRVDGSRAPDSFYDCAIDAILRPLPGISDDITTEQEATV